MKYNKKILIYIFIAALILRLLSLAVFGAFFGFNTLNDDHEYGIIARSLLSGHGYSVPIVEKSGEDNVPVAVKQPELAYKKEAFKPLKETGQYRPTADQLPFYPMVLALIYHFAGSPLSFWITAFLQAIFSSATCIILYQIALKLFDSRAAMITVTIAAVYPAFILATVRIFPEVFFAFWLSLSILFLINSKNVLSIKSGLIAGILIGITLLNSNIVVPLIPFIIVYIFWTGGSWKDGLKKNMLVMITAFLIVSPWVARNYLVFNEFPLMKSTMGLNLWLGNNPKATGTFFLPSGEPMDSVMPASLNEGFKLSETAQEKIAYDDVVSYIKKDTAHYAKLFFKRLYYFAWFPPDNLLSPDGRFFKKLFRLPYGFVLVSGIAGIILCLKKGSADIFLLCAVMFAVLFLYSVFIVGNMRYRVPVEPYLIIFSSYAISLLSDRYIPASIGQYGRKKI